MAYMHGTANDMSLFPHVYLSFSLKFTFRKITREVKKGKIILIA
jgi:hypothetical protein